MDVTEISKILPHRHPFLLVDRVLEYTPGEKLTGYKNVTLNEPFFQGHFPGHPVMPGVLILEALAQACALLAYKSEKLDASKLVVYLMAIDGAKFRKPVVPGDQLHLEVTPLRKGGAVWKLRGEAKVNGQVVTEAEFLATIQKRDGVA